VLFQLSHLVAQVAALTKEVTRLNAALAQQQAENSVLQGQCAELHLQLRAAAATGTQGPKRARSANGRGPTTPDRSAITEVDMTASPEERRGGPARRLEGAALNNGC
jgi:hypothetical protein